MNFATALGWTLVHFVWEGALIAALVALAHLILRRASANLRYLSACGAMLLMLAAPVVTLLAIAGRQHTTTGHISGGESTGGVAHYFPVLIGLWITGVVLLSVWSAGGWMMARRLRRRSRSPIPAHWQSRLEHLSRRVGVRRTVRIFQTALTDVPMVIGWLRPVILVPVCAITSLNVLQLEALLAHELAHIRRHDYLVNLVQTAIETLLFYHPGVWWLGSRIREERENCCDDIAVTVCGNTLVYASALANLEESRAAGIRLAMAASNGSLLTRIRRLTSAGQLAGSSTPGWLVTFASILGIVVLLAAPSLRLGASERRAGERPAKPSFVAGLMGAGYTDLSVDEIILLKESGVSAQYVKSVAATGFGKPGPRDLIELHNNGVKAEHLERAHGLGLKDFSVDRIVKMKQAGVLSGGR
jgi:beta-lactamase regulating signal transducer with metallopeptidase domain